MTAGFVKTSGLLTLRWLIKPLLLTELKQKYDSRLSWKSMMKLLFFLKGVCVWPSHRYSHFCRVTPEAVCFCSTELFPLNHQQHMNRLLCLTVSHWVKKLWQFEAHLHLQSLRESSLQGNRNYKLEHIRVMLLFCHYQAHKGSFSPASQHRGQIHACFQGNSIEYPIVHA